MRELTRRQSQEYQIEIPEQSWLGSPPKGSDADSSSGFETKENTVSATVLRFLRWIWSFALPGVGCDFGRLKSSYRLS
jgi:hypothetical protein